MGIYILLDSQQPHSFNKWLFSVNICDIQHRAELRLQIALQVVWGLHMVIN